MAAKQNHRKMEKRWLRGAIMHEKGRHGTNAAQRLEVTRAEFLR